MGFLHKKEGGRRLLAATVAAAAELSKAKRQPAVTEIKSEF